MKCTIFGTGNYYKRYCRYINDEDVLFLLDNDESKWGKIVNGKEVLPPERVKNEEYDFIIVMVMQYEKIEAQLISYGIPAEKIKNYQDISYLYNLSLNIESMDGRCNLELWKENHPGKKVFVCAPEFSRTGVPVATMHICRMLKEMRYEVLASALVGGTLEEELYENEIDYISDLWLFSEDENFWNVLLEFDLFFCVGLGVARFGNVLAEFDVPIVWWLHESDDKYYEKHPLVIKDNIHYYAGGKRVIERFHKHYGMGGIKELLYFLPDLCEKESIQKNDETIIFSLIGSVIRRKGQDIFLQAIKQMDIDKRKKANFIMVGSYKSAENWGEIGEWVKEIENLVWIDEMSQKELEDFFKKIDVLVCPSRDDPMPIVVTQAFQNGIPCIVSDQVGQCEYLFDGNGGDVFDSENVGELSEIMCKYLEDCNMVKTKGKYAQMIFENHFSEAAMRQNLENILKDLMF